MRAASSRLEVLKRTFMMTPCHWQLLTRRIGRAQWMTPPYRLETRATTELDWTQSYSASFSKPPRSSDSSSLPQRSSSAAVWMNGSCRGASKRPLVSEQHRSSQKFTTSSPSSGAPPTRPAYTLPPLSPLSTVPWRIREAAPSRGSRGWAPLSTHCCWMEIQGSSSV